jgi:hypothetical protein
MGNKTTSGALSRSEQAKKRSLALDPFFIELYLTYKTGISEE